jgi:hypothetical protein
MMHKDRIWCVADVATEVELAAKLVDHTWTCCTAFRLGGYLFLNDSTSEDGAQEYAVVKELPGGKYLQVESITFGWCDLPEGLRYVEDCLAGKFDGEDFTRPVTPRLDTPEQHRNRHCARCA